MNVVTLAPGQQSSIAIFLAFLRHFHGQREVGDAEVRMESIRLGMVDAPLPVHRTGPESLRNSPDLSDATGTKIEFMKYPQNLRDEHRSGRTLLAEPLVASWANGREP